jgi:hypothetical protein
MGSQPLAWFCEGVTGTVFGLILVVAFFAPCCGVISVASEQLLTLSQLAKRLPRHRNDRPVHPSTCHRWRSPGVRGVRLECVRIGGIWHTSWEAFQRFCECLTALEGGGGTPPATSGRPVEGEDYQDSVEQELRDLGA